MKIENAVFECGDKLVSINLMIMDKCCFIWIGSANEQPSMGTLVSAMETKFGVLSSSLLGGDVENGSGMGQRLAKKFKIQSFVSYNLSSAFDDEKFIIERKVVDLLKPHFEIPEQTNAL